MSAEVLDVTLTAGERLTELTRVLSHEAAVVGRLQEALQAQRAALAADDPQGVESSVHGIGAVLAALDRARRQRGKVMDTLTGDPDLPLDRLETLVGAPLPPPLVQARAALRQAAEAAARDARVNRIVLKHAMAAGDAFLQALLTSASPAPVYSSTERRDGPPVGSLLVDRTI
jgi:hypothetical protein